MVKNRPTRVMISSLRMIKREFLKDKWALTALILLCITFVTIFIWALFLDTDKVMTVSVLQQYDRPGTNGMILGADQGGRDVLSMLILGARNSITIGFAVTLMMLVIGILFGVIAGYYGGFSGKLMKWLFGFMMTMPKLLLNKDIVAVILHY